MPRSNEDQHGMLWLATKPDGLVRFDRTRAFTRYRNNPGDPASLNKNEALSLLEDREGRIWVGTNGGGVNRFSSKPPPFTVPERTRQSKQLGSRAGPSVFEDSQGILWIGTKQLNRLDRKTGRYTFYRHDPANPGSITAAVYAMVEDRAGVLWFGTWGGGLNRFDRRTGRFKAYRHDPADAASLSHDYIYPSSSTIEAPSGPARTTVSIAWMPTPDTSPSFAQERFARTPVVSGPRGGPGWIDLDGHLHAGIAAA